MLTDPTYLRYIFDGLESQSIHKDNISALPEGLIGIYEEALPPEDNVQDREKFLSFFATWALLKKEVSASLISELLNRHEQDVIDCLSVYTKWFNSPTSGTYILYHERLRVFLLEKISFEKLNITNQKIISFCQTALEQRKVDEWEIYALEHLPSHLLISGMQDDKQGDIFKKLVYDTSYWNRQLEISKGYDWSKKMLNLALGWAAKQSTDELIECALNKVDLHNMEQNDAPRIVELVVQNEIETALQCFESFGGNDKEGLQRKFMLYMLCLLELTLLDGKEKPFRKTAIEKILNHLDENVQVDHSLLNWNDFFPSFLMFQMACEWAAMGVNYIFLYNHTETCETEWITVKSPYSNHQFNVLIECAQNFSDDQQKEKSISVIATELIKQGNEKEALKILGRIEDSSRAYRIKDIIKELSKQKLINQSIILADKIDDQYYKSLALKEISVELFNQNQVEDAENVLEDSIQCVQNITDDWLKNDIIVLVAAELVRQGNEEVGFAYFKEINSEYHKNEVLELIAFELVKLGKIDESLRCAADITDESKINKIHRVIVIELGKQGKLEEAIKLSNSIKYESYDLSPLIALVTELAKLGRIEEALSCASTISNNLDNSRAYSGIAYALAEQSEFQESLKYVNEISHEAVKSETLRDIATEMAKQGRVEDSINCAHQIKYASYEGSPFYELAIQLAKHGLVEDCLYCVGEIISGYDDKNLLLCKIFTEFINIGKTEESKLFIYKYFSTSSGYKRVEDKNWALKRIANRLADNELMNEAIACANAIIYESHDTSPHLDIAIRLVNSGRLDGAEKFINEIIDEGEKSGAILALASKFFINENLQRFELLVEQSLMYARNIKDERNRSEALLVIIRKIYNQAKKEEIEYIVNESIDSALKIDQSEERDYLLRDISQEIIKLDWIEKSFSCAVKICDEMIKDDAYAQIAEELAKIGNIEAAIACVKNIYNESTKSEALRSIVTEIASTDKLEYAAIITDDISDEYQKKIALESIAIALAKKEEVNASLDYAFRIKNNNDKSHALNKIAGIFASLGKMEQALFIWEKSIDIAAKLEQGFGENNALGDIAAELAKYARFEEAFSCAYKITDDLDKNLAFRNIAFELARLGIWELAENTLLKISMSEDRHRYWSDIAYKIVVQVGLKKAIHCLVNLQDEEARLFYLRGCTLCITIDDISHELTREAIHSLNNDSDYLSHFLQIYAQHELFFGKPSQEKINRLNKTLNLQWALDIIAQFPKE